jgi:hypothetical protein
MTSPWTRPTADFEEEFELAAEYRAIKDRESWERELAEPLREYLFSKYDFDVLPLTKVEGERLGILARRYVEWCREQGVLAIPGSPLWVCVYLDQLRDEGTSDMDLAETANAISRAHFNHGHSDPTSHPYVNAVVSNLTRKETH